MIASQGFLGAAGNPAKNQLFNFHSSIFKKSSNPFSLHTQSKSLNKHANWTFNRWIYKKSNLIPSLVKNSILEAYLFPPKNTRDQAFLRNECPAFFNHFAKNPAKIQVKIRIFVEFYREKKYQRGLVKNQGKHTQKQPTHAAVLSPLSSFRRHSLPTPSFF